MKCNECANAIVPIRKGDPQRCKLKLLRPDWCEYEKRYTVSPDWHEQQQKRRKR